MSIESTEIRATGSVCCMRGRQRYGFGFARLSSSLLINSGSIFPFAGSVLVSEHKQYCFNLS